MREEEEACLWTPGITRHRLLHLLLFLVLLCAVVSFLPLLSSLSSSLRHYAGCASAEWNRLHSHRVSSHAQEKVCLAVLQREERAKQSVSPLYQPSSCRVREGSHLRCTPFSLVLFLLPLAGQVDAGTAGQRGRFLPFVLFSCIQRVELVVRGQSMHAYIRADSWWFSTFLS